jgi:XTP/dITP diphosphohydrolase
MHTLLFATKNPGKQREIKRMMDELSIRVLFPGDLDRAPDIPETGSSFEENARLKAVGYRGLAPEGCIVAAEDSGLVVPALGGAPGIYSARYGGLQDDTSRNALLLKNMADLHGPERQAYYEAVIVLIDPDGREVSFRGRCTGFIAEKPAGAGGFGYDPVFFRPDLNRTFAEVDSAAKDALSHRGEALDRMKRYLEEEIHGTRDPELQRLPPG